MVFRSKRIYGEYAKDLNRTGFSSSSVIVFTFLFSFQERKWIQRDICLVKFGDFIQYRGKENCKGESI